MWYNDIQAFAFSSLQYETSGTDCKNGQKLYLYPGLGPNVRNKNENLDLYCVFDFAMAG